MHNQGKQTEHHRSAGNFNDTFKPYFAHSFKHTENMKKFYPALDITFDSPAFLKEDEAFTTQEEMMAFLYDLVATSDNASIEIIGHSSENREIPMVIFSTSVEGSASFQEKPTVWLQAQVHGNEPAAGESALVIAKELAQGSLKDVLDDVNVVIVPRINPDSSYYFERNSATNLNGNRDHINLEMVELQYIHQAFQRFQAEVVIDAHEYGAMLQYKNVGNEGAVKAQDVLLLAGKNLNIPVAIREKAEEWFIQEPFKKLHEKEYSHGSYYLVTGPDEEPPVAVEGGTDAGTGRNTFALKPSFSILVETLGIGIGRENFLRRVDGQVVTHTTIIRTAAKHATEVKTIISKARETIVNGGRQGSNNDSIIIKSERKELKNRTVEAIDIEKGETVEIPIQYYSASEAVPTLTRKRPTAYILPPAFQHIAQKLETLGARVDRLAAGVDLEVECFEVKERSISNKGDRPLSAYTTEMKEEKRYFDKGSHVIMSAQPVAHLISLALEPESVDSYFTYNFIPTYIGGELPVYRYMKEETPLLK